MIILRTNRTILLMVVLIFYSLGYIVLAGSTIGSSTIQYDEFTDLMISSALSEHPLSGSSHDGSQARLPMYINAFGFRIVQGIEPGMDVLDFLPISRWISILMTVMAIGGILVLGTHLFGPSTGLLAAALFAFSPYVLHFGQDALTQGDAYAPAIVVFTLYAFVRFNDSRSTIWLTVFSLLVAATIAVKFFLVVLIPPFFIYSYLSNRDDSRYVKRQRDVENNRNWLKSQRLFFAVTMATGLFTLVALILAFLRHSQALQLWNFFNLAARAFWMGALLGILCILLLSFGRFFSKKDFPANSDEYWSLNSAWVVILSLAFAASLALFPSHIFNRFVLEALFNRFVGLGAEGSIFSETISSAKLYLGILLFKLGLPFGIATVIALVWSVKRAFKDNYFLLFTLIILFYGVLLTILPLQQPFWLMSIYPIIMLILSEMIIEGFKKFKSPVTRKIWLGGVLFSGAWLVYGLTQVYPTFKYYGYEIIGDEWLGENSRGYKGVVIVTNDGSTEAIDWLEKNASPNSVVLSYLDDIHLLNYLEKTRGFNFSLEHALHQYNQDNRIDWASADYLMLRGIDDNDLPWPLAEPGFSQVFGESPIFQVLRGRGIYRLSVIIIFEKKYDYFP